MIRLILIYGLIGGLIIAVPMVTFMTTKPGAVMQGGALYGYLTMIIALTTVFLGIKRYRDKELGGVIKFGTALVVGLGISFVASILYVIGWELSLALTNFDFPQVYGKSLMEAARAKGASEAELQKIAADAESFARMYANPLFRMPITFVEIFPVGALISLISAAILRNSRVLPAREIATSR